MSPTSYHCSTPRRRESVYRAFQMGLKRFRTRARQVTSLALSRTSLEREHALKLNACLLLVLVWRPNGPGTGLFSRGLVTPVSWALERFTTVFGMGTGGTTPLSPPGPFGRSRSDDDARVYTRRDG